MFPTPPPGQGPVESKNVFSPPQPPVGAAGSGGPTGQPPHGPQGAGWFPPPIPPGSPPPMMYPPPMYPPPPPPRSDRSFARVIFTTLAATIFGLSLMLNLYALLWLGMRSGGADNTTVAIIEGDKTQKIAVIPIEGMILGDAVEAFEKLIIRVEEDRDVQALVIEIDSPGGGVAASAEIHHRLLTFKQRRNIPVIISMQALATSGGYYIACAGDYIYAQPSTWTGNIGVMMPRVNIAPLAERWGIEDASLHSTGSDFKTAGSMLKPETPDERAYMLGLIDEAFAQFKSVVQAGRTNPDGSTRLTAPIEDIANGMVYSAQQARQLGLIDAIGYASDAYAYAQAELELSNPHVVRYQHRPSFMELLGANSTLGDAGALGDGQGGGVRLDRRAIEELFTPRLMYLWRVQ